VGLLPLIVIKVREVVEQQAGSTQQPSQQPAQGAQRQ